MDTRMLLNLLQTAAKCFLQILLEALPELLMEALVVLLMGLFQ
jgi:hypothetical protein